MKDPINIFWFRRDLRLHDNAGLFHALKAGLPVLPIFIFDRNILDKLENKQDRRVEFIHQALTSMQEQLKAIGRTIEVFYGFPNEVFNDLTKTYTIADVYTNHDYEPYAVERDAKIEKTLGNKGIGFHTFKDQVIFEKGEVIKEDGTPYTVFTPYSRKWKSSLNATSFAPYLVEDHSQHFLRKTIHPIPSLASMGFEPAGMAFPPEGFTDELIMNYASNRDYPGKPGTSRLGVHLRFGTISIRELTRHVAQLSETFLNELIWREFYQMILWHFPRVGKGHAFKPAYENIPWRNNEEEFARWCEGNTGYPIVDAGMRELNATGFMHNRVRMIVASFLCKHLLIDWRWGESYFAEKLLDFDLASNNGGWQWAAGSGCDAAPYFRIFNPRLQTEKFDKDLSYIRQWVPEFQEFRYLKPIVDHEFARKRCLETYASVLREGKLQGS
jgi:deoxyribodipyrimidine photo-lyase